MSQQQFLVKGKRSSSNTLWTAANTTTTAWFDSATTATITSSSNVVTSMADRSGNGHTLTSHIGNVTTNVRSINGLNVLDFSGNVGLNFSSGLLSVPATSTVFLVFRTDATRRQDIYSGLVGAGSRHAIVIQRLATNGVEVNSNTAFAPASATFAGLTGTNLVRFTAESGTITLFEFDTSRATGTSGAVTLDTLRLGVRGTSGTDGFDGAFAELIRVDAAISAGDIQRFEGYLAHKWGFTASLSSGHPYKTTPPYV